MFVQVVCTNDGQNKINKQTKLTKIQQHQRSESGSSHRVLIKHCCISGKTDEIALRHETSMHR